MSQKTGSSRLATGFGAHSGLRRELSAEARRNPSTSRGVSRSTTSNRLTPLDENGGTDKCRGKFGGTLHYWSRGIHFGGVA